MSAFDFPILDGIAPSWADITVRISPGGSGAGGVLGALAGAVGGGLVNMGDIAKISSGWTVEVGEQREGGRVIKRTRGTAKNEASMTLYASGYQKLLRGLALAAPKNSKGQSTISLVTFLVHVVWTPPGAVDLLEYKLKGCRILGRTIDASEGDDPQQVEVPLSPIEIVDVIDGVEVVPV